MTLIEKLHVALGYAVERKCARRQCRSAFASERGEQVCGACRRFEKAAGRRHTYETAKGGTSWG